MYKVVIISYRSFSHIILLFYLGNTFAGYNGVANEDNITIVSLMRGGEPMARGVFKVFTKAFYFHYFEGEDIQKLQVATTNRTVILVDSVINSGDSIRNLVNAMLPSECKRIIVIAGVIQKNAATTLVEEYRYIRFFSLRVSSNEYKGRGANDTGNRLYGTTSLNV